MNNAKVVTRVFDTICRSSHRRGSESCKCGNVLRVKRRSRRPQPTSFRGHYERALAPSFDKAGTMRSRTRHGSIERWQMRLNNNNSHGLDTGRRVMVNQQAHEQKMQKNRIRILRWTAALEWNENTGSINYWLGKLRNKYIRG